MAQHLLRQGTRWRVGDGHKINIWTEPWLPVVVSLSVQTMQVSGLEEASVNMFFFTRMRGVGIWNTLSNIFNERDRRLILQIPLSQSEREDILFWKHEQRGAYVRILDMTQVIRRDLINKIKGYN